jgi:hypothetical protein
MVHLDIEKAFATTWQPGLLCKLSELEFSTCLIKQITYLLTDIKISCFGKRRIFYTQSNSGRGASRLHLGPVLYSLCTINLSNQSEVRVRATLGPTFSQPVSLGVKSLLGPKTRFLLLSFAVLSMYGPSITRGRVCYLPRKSMKSSRHFVLSRLWWHLVLRFAIKLYLTCYFAQHRLSLYLDDEIYLRINSTSKKKTIPVTGRGGP